MRGRRRAGLTSTTSDKGGLECFNDRLWGFDDVGFVNDDANFAKSPAREKDKEVRLQVLLPVTC